MSKQSGLGATFLISGHDLSGDVGSLDSISGGPAPLDVTGIKSFATERIGGLRSGDLQFTSWFNIGTGQEHAVLKTLPATDVIGSGYFASPAIGNPAFSINGKQLNYDPTRGADGSLSFKIEVQSNSYGLEWGELLTAGLITDTTATTHTSKDEAAGTSFGAQAYLQVTAITGTSVTVKVRHSTDNSTFTDLIAFTAATTAGAQRVAVTGTVDRYIEVVTSGTFTSATFAVMFARNTVKVDF